MRALGGGRGEVSFGGGAAAQVSIEVVRLLLEFIEPASCAEVLPGIDARAPAGALDDALAGWVQAGVLVPVAPPAPAAPAPAGGALALPFGERLRQPELLALVSQHLQAGDLCVIDDAFAPDFAEEVFASLDAFSRWRPHADAIPFFGYHHYNIYDRALFPPALRRCHELFGHPATRRLAQDLSGQDCSGQPQVSASLYLPGDYSLPHDDASPPRSVSFVWHLTREWDPSWGGHFTWCSPLVMLAPRFNTLTLFNVRPARSFHFVAPVSPVARGKRLSVNGWWTSGARETAAPPSEPPMQHLRSFPAGIAREVADGLTVVASSR